MQAHVHRLVSVVKIATVFDRCITNTNTNTKEQHFIVRFLWAKGLSAKDIHKEMIPA
jgi:hypothetical protein